MSNQNDELRTFDNQNNNRNLLVIDTDKIENAISSAIKPLVELWVEKSNETEQLRITTQKEIEEKKIILQTRSLNTDRIQFFIFTAVFILTVALAIILEFIGRFTMTTGIIITAVLTLSATNIAASKSKPKD